MSWLARYIEFLSPESITNCLLTFKELYKVDNPTERQAFIKAKHDSTAVLTVINLLTMARRMDAGEEAESKLAILLSILESLLINDNNLEQALNPTLRLVDTLIDLVRLHEKMPMFIKYGLRCLTSVLRASGAVVAYVNSNAI